MRYQSHVQLCIIFALFVSMENFCWGVNTHPLSPQKLEAMNHQQPVRSSTPTPATPNLAVSTQPVASSNYHRFGNRLSATIKVGAGPSILSTISQPIPGSTGSHTSPWHVQGYLEGQASLGIDIHRTCVSSRSPCIRVYGILPAAGAGYSFSSALPFFDAGVGLGFQVMPAGGVGFFTEAGVGVKFSPIRSLISDQQAAGAQGFLRDPTDTVIPWVFGEVGVSIDLKSKAHLEKDLLFQISVRLADGPSALYSSLKSLDMSLLFGVRAYFLK